MRKNAIMPLTDLLAKMKEKRIFWAPWGGRPTVSAPSRMTKSMQASFEAHEAELLEAFRRYLEDIARAVIARKSKKT